MNHVAIVQPGSEMCVCGMHADHPVHGFVEWSPLDLPCEYCGERVRDHTPMELKSCVRDIAIRDAAKRMNQAIEDLPIPDVEKQKLRSDLATLGREGRSSCATCGHYGSYDNELILDDEGDVFCEECWNP